MASRSMLRIMMEKSFFNRATKKVDSTRTPFKFEGGGVKQAYVYSQLSNNHGHITDCKLDSVVYAGVCVI